MSLLYDSRYLYVHAELQDDDLVAESDGDQVMLCNFGDVFEIFLKPADANHYWEIHISPKNQKLVLFYPGRGYHFLPSVGPRKKSPLPGLKSSVRLNGTLNRRMDQRPVLECHSCNSACRTCGAGNRIETGKQMENTDCPLQLFQSSAEQGADNLSTAEETEFSCS